MKIEYYLVKEIFGRNLNKIIAFNLKVQNSQNVGHAPMLRHNCIDEFLFNIETNN